MTLLLLITLGPPATLFTWIWEKLFDIRVDNSDEYLNQTKK